MQDAHLTAQHAPRRVKSLVRELEVKAPSGSAGAAGGANGQTTAADSTSGGGAGAVASGMTSSRTMPSLHSRNSNSSLSSQTSSVGTATTPDTTALLSPMSSLGRKTSTSSAGAGPAGDLVYNGGAATPGSSRYAPAQYQAGTGGGGVDSARRDSNALLEPLDAPNSLEEDEEGDIFLPLNPNSPFSPNYSMGGGSSSNPNSPSSAIGGGRRDSGSFRVNSGPPPSSSQQMTAAERREHSRRHSRVHSRNLSVFFPRPEQQGLPGYQTHEHDNEEEDGVNASVAVDIPGAETRGWGFSNKQMPTRANQQASQQYLGQSDESAMPNSRRGHHHRHSMSHNLFPFIDTNGSHASAPGSASGSPRRISSSSLSPSHAMNGAKSPLSPSSTLSTPRSVPALSSSVSSRHRHSSSDPSLIPSISLRNKYSHLPSPVRFGVAVAFHLPILTQIALAASAAEIALGASLWITGQSGESLAVTGLGYLVVFDGMAALSSVLVEGNARGTERLWDIMQGRRAADNGVRYPFG